MTGTLAIIADRVAMLALLHEALRRRAIVYPEAADQPLLYEYPGERIEEERGRILAAIDEEGSAYELLCAAIEADVLFDLPVWGALPVRFLPAGTVTWVSPDHPAVATAPRSWPAGAYIWMRAGRSWCKWPVRFRHDARPTSDAVDPDENRGDRADEAARSPGAALRALGVRVKPGRPISRRHVG